jgi:hypothetical protein
MYITSHTHTHTHSLTHTHTQTHTRTHTQLNGNFDTETKATYRKSEFPNALHNNTESPCL